MFNFIKRLFRKEGNEGTSMFEAKIYRAARRAPSTPKGGYYDFGAETLCVPQGWTPKYPKDVGTEHIWMSVGLFEQRGDQGRDTKVVWSKPEKP